jgi:hypothetical protein
VIDKYGDSLLGTMKLSEIHLSNRWYIETFLGKRVHKGKDEDYNEELNGYYACESKIVIEDE